MILQIRLWPDPILLTPCKPWTFDNTLLSPTFADDLIETMIDEGGIGLAANQVGIEYRIMALWSQETNEQIVLYNPEIVEQSSELWEAAEGCLSFPRVELTISRPKTVTVRYQDETQTWHTKTFNNIDAKCFLHELDHLNGITFKDYVSPLKFGRAIEKGRKK